MNPTVTDVRKVLSIIARYEDSIGQPQAERWTLVTGQPQWLSGDHFDQHNPVQGIKPLDFQRYYSYATRCFEYLKFGTSVDAVIAKKYPFYEALYVCKTPDILKQLGWKETQFFHTQKHLLDKELKLEEHGGHELPVELIKRVPELLEQPVAVFNSLTQSKALVVLLDAYDPAGRPLNAALRQEGIAQYKGHQIKGSIVLSIYGRSSIERFLQHNVDKHTVKYVDKEKIKKLIPSAALQLLGTYMSFSSSVQHGKKVSQPQSRDDLALRISERSSNHSIPFQVSPSISPERPKR